MEDSKLMVALLAGVVSVVTAIFTSLVAAFIANKKHMREHKLDYQVENLVLKFLNHPTWRFRTFKTIKHHIAGFEDDELRKILVRVGALRFNDSEGIEIWGLYERVQSEMEAEANTRDN